MDHDGKKKEEKEMKRAFSQSARQVGSVRVPFNSVLVAEPI